MRWIVFEPCIALLLLLEILSVTNAAKRVRQIHLINKNGNNVNQNKKPRAEPQTQLSPDHEPMDSKSDFRDMEGFEQYFNKNQFPPKVIHVTKTVAVHIPIAVPVERVHGGESQGNQFFLQQNNRETLSTAPPVTQRRGTSPKPVSPMQPAKINSLEALNMQNSIWQQNFPPFSQHEMKSEIGQRPEKTRTGSRPGTKQRTPSPTLPSKPTPLEDIPQVASILISQDPNTKAINIQIPGNAGMSDNFLDDVQKNPMGLLKSLNLTPIQSFAGVGPTSPSTSFDMPVSGTPNNFLPSGFASTTTLFGRNPSSQSEQMQTDFQTFYTEAGIGDPDLSAFSEFSSDRLQSRPSSISGNTFMPSYEDYLASRQNSFSLPSDAVSSSSNSTKYVTSSMKERGVPKHYQTHTSPSNHHQQHHPLQSSNTIPHNAEVQYKTSYRYKNQPIDPNNFRDLPAFDETLFNQGTRLFAGTFPKDDSRFSGSDARATLREYEKRVEKEILDTSGMHSMKSSLLVTAPEMEPTITPLIPLPLVSERPRRLRPLPTLSSIPKGQSQKAREQKYKIKIKKS